MCRLSWNLGASNFWSPLQAWKGLVQLLKLCTGRTVHRESRGIALLFPDHGTRMGWGVSVTPRPLFTPGKDPVPIIQEAGWAPRPIWNCAENLAPIGIRSPHRPACSSVAIPTELPGPHMCSTVTVIRNYRKALKPWHFTKYVNYFDTETERHRYSEYAAGCMVQGSSPNDGKRFASSCKRTGRP